METAATLTHTLKTLGQDLLLEVLARDHLSLKTRSATRAAKARLSSGIRVLEAFVRRLLLTIALLIEPDLPNDTRPRFKYSRAPSVRKPRLSNFRMTLYQRPLTDSFPRKPWDKPYLEPGTPVPVRRLLARLAHLSDLLKDPTKPARRLAFHLARKRPGVIFAPRGDVPRSYGTEISATHDALGERIRALSRARPPPLGPPPRAPPRIRSL